MDCPETWYIELHLLCLDATQVWEPDIQSWCFYFVGSDPGMTRAEHHPVYGIWLYKYGANTATGYL